MSIYPLKTCDCDGQHDWLLYIVLRNIVSIEQHTKLVYVVTWAHNSTRFFPASELPALLEAINNAT